jgi:hypothetical protein
MDLYIIIENKYICGHNITVQRGRLATNVAEPAHFCPGSDPTSQIKKFCNRILHNKNFESLVAET